MKTISLVGLAGAAVMAMAASTTSVQAGDLGGLRKWSGKDGYVAPVREAMAPVGNCYFRADVGYSFARDPKATWPVSNIDIDAGGNYTYTYIGDQVSTINVDNVPFGGVGLGCGSGSRGIRGEFMLNQYGWRGYDGRPQEFVITDASGGPGTTGEDPVHTRIRSTTAMFNAYYDLGQFGRFTPYVGAGVGVAYNRTDEAYFTENPYLLNRIQGGSRLALAWSLMAGVGVQVSDRAIIDIGYRFTDLGKAETGRVDSAGFLNPAVKFDELRNHEVRVGLRYHFGSSDCCASVPMK